MRIETDEQWIPTFPSRAARAEGMTGVRVTALDPRGVTDARAGVHGYFRGKAGMWHGFNGLSGEGNLTH